MDTLSQHTGSNFVAGQANLPLLNEIAGGMRRKPLMYSHKISDALAKELTNYVAFNDDVTDLSNEMAILRQQVGEHLYRYDQAMLIPVGPTANGGEVTESSKAMYVDACAVQLNMAVQRVQDCALTMAKIQASRQGKFDIIVLNRLAANLSQQVDNVLHEVASRTNDETARTTSDRIAALISGEVAAVTGKHNSGFGTGPIVSERPATLTADDLLREMMASVPFAGHDSDTDIEPIDEPTDIEVVNAPNAVSQTIEIRPIQIQAG